MVVFYNNEVPSRQMASYKLTQREFEEKYAGGYQNLVERMIELVKSIRTKSQKNETNHRALLDSLFTKRKLLKKHQEELNLVREIHRANVKEENVNRIGKADPRDEQTEVKICNLGFYSPE